MKKPFLLTPLLFLWILSCTHEENLQTEKKIQFSFTNVSKGTSGGSKGVNGGRISDASTTGDPQSVMVTIKDDAGNTVVSQQALTLYKFGDSFLSLPLTLKASSTSNYHLSEFFVMGSDNQVDYTTPREGSALAHLVADPLDILFTVDVNSITTVTPEVLAVSDSSNATDYGYGQFGFSVVKTISAVFSSFIKGTSNFELTSAHLKIEGLKDSTSSDTTALWVYETDLAVKANTIVLKEAVSYRITATKDGYQPWVKNLALTQGSNVEMFFDQVNDEVDIYMAGDMGVATYWKNGIPVHLSTVHSSHASRIFVSEDNVYVTGNESSQDENAFYWKNDSKVIFQEIGSTGGIFVSGNDVYVSGSTGHNTTPLPAYWKNGNKTDLPVGSYSRGFASNLIVDGTDVYICGKIYNGSPGQEIGVPVLWKNGSLIELPLPDPSYNAASAGYVVVSDGHVYVSGTLATVAGGKEHAAYWKDGQLTILGAPTATTLAGGIAVENGDIYVVGEQTNAQTGWAGKYWKNGQEVLVNPETNVNLYGISVLNGNVYLAGDYRKTVEGNPSTATYWVNGKLTQGSTGGSFAYSIFVVAK